ncbi:hypothetical protein [Haloarcula litorea]|uniref:hypothetical protein n=1 Tax=Haloarcula litorea TaxID=3032579 RepID=UPI0023E824C2|nr:hypothetical protein [Halomicroarcula sp. GDY20]
MVVVSEQDNTATIYLTPALPYGADDPDINEPPAGLLMEPQTADSVFRIRFLLFETLSSGVQKIISVLF